MPAAAIIAAAVATAYSAHESSSAASAARGATEAGEKAGLGYLNKSQRTADTAVGHATRQAINADTKALSASLKNYAPYQKAGTTALSQLETLLGLGKGGEKSALKALESTPGFQFAEKQGDQATINAATATGMNLSGNTLKGLSEFNQGLATQTFQNDVGNLENLVGTGLQASTLAGQSELQTGANIANIDMNKGNTLADIAMNTGTAKANVSIGQATNEANISMANAASQAGIVNNAANDFALFSLMNNNSGQNSQSAGTG